MKMKRDTQEDNDKEADFRKSGKSAIRVLFIITAVLLLIVIGVLVWRLVSINKMYDEVRDDASDYSHFREMIEKNPEVVAWLKVKDTEISTVVTQGSDNTKYLNTNVYGEVSFAGNPFLDYRNDRNFTDRYSIIYGHLAEDHLMFGDLKLFTDPSFWKETRTGTLELRDGTTLHITFFACRKARADDSMYFDPRRVMNNWNDEFLASMMENPIVSNDEIKTDDRILVLSTCESAESDNRILLFGKLK